MSNVKNVDDILKLFMIKKEIMKPNRDVYVIESKNIREVMKILKEFYKEDMYLATIISVDKLNENRFELNYFIHIISLGKTIVIKTYVARNDAKIDSIVDIIPGAYEAEAEVYDLMGIEFLGNKYLKRGFFVPTDLVSQNVYPLRKDSQA